MGILVTIAFGVVLGVISNEVFAWMSPLARWLAQEAAKRCPPKHRVRLSEEWFADLDCVPTPLAKVIVSLTFFWATLKLWHEQQSAPQDTQRKAISGSAVAMQSATVSSPAHVDDSQFLTVTERTVRSVSIPIKTAFDLVTASLMLVLFAIPMLLIAWAIKLESPGPVIFRQQRTGLGGKVFRIWKFRSMRVLEDGELIRQTDKEDRRVTRVGRIIRRLSLDELPQIFNVLAGDMSIVGPRPHARAHDAYFVHLIPGYRDRFRAKPGITGLAQIHGCIGETRTIDDMANRVRLDNEYASNYSLWRDIWIVLITPFFGLFRHDSY